VVVDLGGEHVFVYLGNLLGEKINKAKVKTWHTALVDLVDPDKLAVIPHTWHALPPGTMVVDVVETIGRRRLMASEYGKRRTRYDEDDSSVDPVLSPRRDGKF
jgi:hypothetical protein